MIRTLTLRPAATLTAILALSLALTACAREPGTAEVTIESDDAMQFNLTEFHVRSGQTVRLTLEHVGELSLEQMGHNVVILKADENPDTFGQRAASEGNRENQWLPEEMRDRVIAFTDMIGGGETTTIEFTAPEPGQYPYLCTFPGHYGVMQGTMVVN